MDNVLVLFGEFICQHVVDLEIEFKFVLQRSQVFYFFHSQELGVLGFSSLFTPSRNGRGPPDTFDIVKLVNSTYELLQQQQRNMKQITDLEQK